MTKFIITDEQGRPMALSGEQLCYCTDEYWEDEPFPVKAYSESIARRYIRKTIEFRTMKGFDPGRYKLMPINLNS